MKVVIDIPEKDYKQGTLCNVFRCYSRELDNIIYSGTVLPKNYGRLIDAKEYENDIRKHYFDNSTVIRCTEIALDNASTIVEADKEEENV